MVADRIAEALKSRSPQTLTGNSYKPAAVLIPVQERHDGDYLVLTQRAEHLPTHKGQIVFRRTGRSARRRRIGNRAARKP
jgi:hypothetical protein